MKYKERGQKGEEGRRGEGRGGGSVRSRVKLVFCLFKTDINGERGV